MKDLTLNLTKINTFWRQIARLRTHAHTYNAGDTTDIHAGTTRGNLSYTAAEVARENEPHKDGNKTKDYRVAWIYWKNNSTARDRKELRKKCKGYGGLTINGDELIVCTDEVVEEIKTNPVIVLVSVYDLKLFE